MRQIWITRTGTPEVLELKEALDPEAGAGQVRVRVRASGINFADLLARVGLYPDAPKLPCVVGYEVSGTVDQIGAGVRSGAGDLQFRWLQRSGGGAGSPDRQDAGADDLRAGRGLSGGLPHRTQHDAVQRSPAAGLACVDPFGGGRCRAGGDPDRQDAWLPDPGRGLGVQA
jgi:hypothetical protein